MFNISFKIICIIISDRLRPRIDCVHAIFGEVPGSCSRIKNLFPWPSVKFWVVRIVSVGMFSNEVIWGPWFCLVGGCADVWGEIGRFLLDLVLWLGESWLFCRLGFLRGRIWALRIFLFLFVLNWCSHRLQDFGFFSNISLTKALWLQFFLNRLDWVNIDSLLREIWLYSCSCPQEERYDYLPIHHLNTDLVIYYNFIDCLWYNI